MAIFHKSGMLITKIVLCLNDQGPEHEDWIDRGTPASATIIGDDYFGKLQN
ncbi:hypothetical protein [Pseudovibrio axinellae]|uniref:hypothetical protein n=1 Tax=Pseudovibrio axinellae TaxID=989403 RepID=UPI001587E8DD|nr:hypothetical protein [Pseudovibrio axinellae]